MTSQQTTNEQLITSTSTTTTHYTSLSQLTEKINKIKYMYFISMFQLRLFAFTIWSPRTRTPLCINIFTLSKMLYKYSLLQKSIECNVRECPHKEQKRMAMWRIDKRCFSPQYAPAELGWRSSGSRHSLRICDGKAKASSLLFLHRRSLRWWFHPKFMNGESPIWSLLACMKSLLIAWAAWELHGAGKELGRWM